VVANTLFKRAEELAREKKISDIRNIKPHHDAMIDILGACERIKRTPIPHSYGFYIKIFISLYVCLLPFLLVDKYGYYTIPAIMFAAYALMGIEMIAGEIEEPFGLDSNDLPLDAMARTIYLNVHEILGVEIKDDPVPGF
jgi:putative membrane protein